MSCRNKLTKKLQEDYDKKQEPLIIMRKPPKEMLDLNMFAHVELSPSELSRATNDWNALKLAYNLPDCAIDVLLKKLEKNL